MEKTLKVSGMHCRSCEMLLTDSISEITGVEKVSADFKKGTVTVSMKDERMLEEVKKAIEKEGYKVLG
jgi:copper chaperone CopZ